MRHYQNETSDQFFFMTQIKLCRRVLNTDSITMLVTDAQFQGIFAGRSSYRRFMDNVSRFDIGATGLQIADVVTSTTNMPEDVHSTTISDEKDHGRIAKWSAAPKKIRVLFTSRGTFVYQPPERMRERNRVRGGTDTIILGKLSEHNLIAHVKWADNDEDAPDTGQVIELKAIIARQKNELLAAKVEAVNAQRYIARLMQSTNAPMHTPVRTNTVKSFTTYTKKIGEVEYEYSDDFRPDIAPAHEWKAEFLFGYLNKNQNHPECIFPYLISVVDYTPRYDTNCDYGVIFEHPITKEAIRPPIFMKKAFRNFHRDYAYKADAFEKYNLNKGG